MANNEENNVWRRQQALALALGSVEPTETTTAILDRAKAFDLFLKGGEAASGDAD